MDPSAKMPLLFRLLLWLAAGMAFVMMVLTTLDVVMRYVFNSPVRGAFEMTEIMMGLMVFAAAPAMTWAGENICVTLLSERFPPRFGRVIQSLCDLTCAVMAALVTWRLWRHGARLLTSREITMELAIPKGYIAQAMAVGMALVALAFLLRVLRGAPAAPEGGKELV